MIRVLAALAMFAGPPVAAQQMVQGTGTMVRGLDKLTGQVADLMIPSGRQAQLGRLTIEMGACRYPDGNPAGDAYAFITINEAGRTEPIFSGWMIASAPALNALDHARYDLWVLRCSTS